MTKRIIPLATSFFIACSIVSCSEKESHKEKREEAIELVIPGRNSDKNLKRPTIYRARVPYGWILKEAPYDESISDTKKPIYTMLIPGEDDDDDIFITVHNFPLRTLDERVPAEAQVARWKKQLGEKGKNFSVTPQAFGGFFGLRFQGDGEIDGKTVTLIAWSMQLAPEHFYALSQKHEGISEQEAEQMRADYTIKVVGPPDFVEKKRQAIDTFARSFHFDKPIPQKR